MREADSLAALVEDLLALSERERRAVLAELSMFERAQVAVLLDAATQPAALDYSRFSPWLARHLSGESATERNLTAATRQLLARAAAELGGGKAPVAVPEVQRRSLADAMTQFLSPRRVPR